MRCRRLNISSVKAYNSIRLNRNKEIIVIIIFAFYIINI